MINHIQVLRMKKLRGSGIINIAARHNLREIQAERGAVSHIDPSRTPLNVILRGAETAAEVAAQAANLMEAAKVKRRKNEVLGLEILFGLPRASGKPELEYFTDSVRWAEAYLEVPILSAVIHHDEASPHCHLIMLPLFNGRMIGSALMGNAHRLKALQADFHAKVGQKYGLKRGESLRRPSAAARAKGADMVINAMRKATHSIDEPTFWDAMRDTITESPAPLMAYFGIEYETPKQPKKTFASIMTKNCPERQPPKPIGNGKHTKPIGTNAVVSAPKDQTLSCVEFADSENNDSFTETPLKGEVVYLRESELDQRADHWDMELGEFIKTQKTKAA